MSAVHPGRITYVDGDSGRVLSSEDASELPLALQFASTPEGEVPVVKVVATRAGDGRTIREYGPRGQLLRTTVQLRG